MAFVPVTLLTTSVVALVGLGALMLHVARRERAWSPLRWSGAAVLCLGAGFTLADAMFAPVVARMISYRVAPGPVTGTYREAVRAHPLVEEWYRAAAAEPAGWRLGKYEDLA